MNPFIVPVAVLMYRVARNLLHTIAQRARVRHFVAILSLPNSHTVTSELFHAAQTHSEQRLSPAQ